MKIRIRGNSIRYRLDKQDITALEQKGKVEEDTVIGAGKLHFCLKSKETDKAGIKLEGPAIHLSLPQQQVTQWIQTDLVGIEHELTNADGSVLKILIEKDFKCLTSDEDQSQAFDNPLANC